MDVLHDDIRNGQLRWESGASCQVLLTVALRDLDSVVDVADSHGIVGNVVDTTLSAATLKITRQSSRGAGPDLDASTITGVGHGDVVDEDILHDVGFCSVLAKRTDTDAVTAVALQVLDQDVGAVGLERDTIVTIVDN